MLHRRSMRIVGIDENGLGPKLGPLVATAVALEVEDYDRARLAEGGLSLGLTDSKQVGRFGKMAFIESVALALIKRTQGAVPSTMDELLDAISLDARSKLRALCPADHVAEQCWSAPLVLPVLGGDVTRGDRVISHLEQRCAVKVCRVRTTLACVRALNDALLAGRSKLVVDLELFERLVLDVRAKEGAPLLAYCGMVGGIRHYPTHFSKFASKSVVEIESNRATRAYQVDGVGEVRFEVSADDRHLPVALASMVGKYVRELSMRRLNDFYRGHHKGLKVASGYHDPVTKEFVTATTDLRKRLQIVSSCFERRA